MKLFTLTMPGLLLLALLSAPHAAADDIDTVFVTPPDPEQLVNLLFGPRYRSADTSTSVVPGRFSMMINFEYDSIKIVPQSLPMLDAVGEALQSEQAKNELLVIEGHADASGPAAYNQRLSERRAEAIKQYLVGTFEIPDETLITIGEGESVPHNRKDPYDAINRRVVFRNDRSIVVQ